MPSIFSYSDTGTAVTKLEFSFYFFFPVVLFFLLLHIRTFILEKKKVIGKEGQAKSLKFYAKGEIKLDEVVANIARVFAPVMQCHEDSSIPGLYELLTKASNNGETDNNNNNNPYTLGKFERFLLKYHCEENYEFWRTCNRYLLKYDDENFDVKKWNSGIYKQFIGENSPMECNLPEDIRLIFKDSYHDGLRIPQVIVQRARQHAWSLMADAYRQYVRQVCKKRGCCNSSRPISRSVSPVPPAVSTRIRRDHHPMKSSSSSNLALPIIEVPTLSVTDNSSSPGSCSNGSAGGDEPRNTVRSPTESPDAVGAGTQRLISKGKGIMSRFRLRNRRTSFASQSPTNSIYKNLERRASDRTLYQK